MSAPSDIQIHARRRMLLVIIIAVFAIFMGRLYQLQLLYSKEFEDKSRENSVRVISTEPVRGYMYDRTGRLVVDNRPAFTVTIMPFEFKRASIPRLAELLGLDPAFIAERLKRGEAYSRFAPVKIKRDVDVKTIAALEEHGEMLPGVGYQTESKRFYPTPARATHLLGYTKEVSEHQLRLLGSEYTQGDVSGAGGLEAHYERILRGEKGAEHSTVNALGQVVGSYLDGAEDRRPIEGDDLLLTLDINLQAYAESLMTDRRGALVAVDVRDGGVLAMVSVPDYNLSLFSGVTPPAIWSQLNSDTAAPLFNRATMTRYPPGSTFKMVLALAALQDSIITPAWRVNCTGAIRVGTKVFKDLHVHGPVTMLDAIQRSCNVYFYELMLKTGLDPWYEMGTQFGFGQRTGIDLVEEQAGLLPSTAYMNQRYGTHGWTRGYLPNLGIGQGELGVTPLQMACYAMAIANRGTWYQPHLVRAIVNKRTGTTDVLPYATHHMEVAPQHWITVREGMRRVVEEQGGTGGLARIPGITSAGKTGTAQNPHGPDHAWYVGFAPFNDPHIAIAVLIENAGFGGSFAAPVAGRCMRFYLERERIEEGLEAPPPVMASSSPASLPPAEGHR
jgi:penicillin-binding protein 2